VVTGALPRLEPLRYVRTDALKAAYFEAGPADGEVALLLHGFPYDIHSYVDVIPRLVEAAAVTLDGLADGNLPATDGSPSARHFTGPRVHHQVPNAGHNLPQEAPDAFASAILELATLRTRPAGG
jgi:pimeloyl-ACP methyl ester carboxylesterase